MAPIPSSAICILRTKRSQRVLRNLLIRCGLSMNRGDTRQWSATYDGMHEKKNEEGRAVHPLVRIHPDTGRKSLLCPAPHSVRVLRG